MTEDLFERSVSLTVTIDEARILFRVLERLRWPESRSSVFRLDFDDGGFASFFGGYVVRNEPSADIDKGWDSEFWEEFASPRRAS